MKKLSSIVYEINCTDDIELQKLRLDDLNRWLDTNFTIKDGKVVYPHITGVYLDLLSGLMFMGL